MDDEWSRSFQEAFFKISKAGRREYASVNSNFDFHIYIYIYANLASIRHSASTTVVNHVQ